MERFVKWPFGLVNNPTASTGQSAWTFKRHLPAPSPRPRPTASVEPRSNSAAATVSTPPAGTDNPVASRPRPASSTPRTDTPSVSPPGFDNRSELRCAKLPPGLNTAARSSPASLGSASWTLVTNPSAARAYASASMSKVERRASCQPPATLGAPRPSGSPLAALPLSKSPELKCAAAPAPMARRAGPKRTPAPSTASISTSPALSERFSTRAKPSRPDGSDADGKNGSGAPASTATPRARNAGRCSSMDAAESGLSRTPRTAPSRSPSWPSSGSRSAIRLPVNRSRRTAASPPAGNASMRLRAACSHSREPRPDSRGSRVKALSFSHSRRSDDRRAKGLASATRLPDSRNVSSETRPPSAETSSMPLRERSSSVSAARDASGVRSATWLPASNSCSNAGSRSMPSRSAIPASSASNSFNASRSSSVTVAASLPSARTTAARSSPDHPAIAGAGAFDASGNVAVARAAGPAPKVLTARNSKTCEPPPASPDISCPLVAPSEPATAVQSPRAAPSAPWRSS